MGGPLQRACVADPLRLHHRDRIRVSRWAASVAALAMGCRRDGGVVRGPDRAFAARRRALQPRLRPGLEPSAAAVRVGHRDPVCAGRARVTGRPPGRRGRRWHKAASIFGHRAVPAQVARLRGGPDTGDGGRLSDRDRGYRRRRSGDDHRRRCDHDGHQRRDRDRHHALRPVRDRPPSAPRSPTGR